MAGTAPAERRCFRDMAMAAQRELLMVQHMQHALHAIHSFLMANAVTAAWHELQAAMGGAASVAAVVHAHHCYLHSILEGCFLVNSTNMGKAITGLIVSLSSKTLLFCALYHSRRSLQRPHSMPSPTPSTTAFATMPSFSSSTPMRTHTGSSSTPTYTPTASSSRGGGREESSKGGAREERGGRAAAEEAAINAEIQQLGDFFHADVSAILQVARNQAEKLPSSIRDLLQQLNYNRFYG
ncbi:unnamed protein product [Closterium sp. NIES-54]